MTHTIEEIKSKPTDFTVCRVCGSFNWHNNVKCCSCGYPDHLLKDLDRIKRAILLYEEYEHYDKNIRTS